MAAYMGNQTSYKVGGTSPSVDTGTEAQYLAHLFSFKAAIPLDSGAYSVGAEGSRLFFLQAVFTSQARRPVASEAMSKGLLFPHRHSWQPLQGPVLSDN